MELKNLLSQILLLCQNIKTETGDVLLGEVVYHKKSLFLRKVGQTITWPFKQIGKMF